MWLISAILREINQLGMERMRSLGESMGLCSRAYKFGRWLTKRSGLGCHKADGRWRSLKGRLSPIRDE